MSGIYLHVDISEILELANLKETVEAAAKDAIRDLSAQSHAHLVELVQQKLHSTREKYLDGLSMHQVSDDTWIISLDAKCVWMEDGLPKHNMALGLLASPKAHTAKDGSRYMSIPFEHNKKPTASTPAQKSLTDTIKAEFKNRKIPYGKLELDSSGQPKKGLLHSFNISHGPTKTADVPGQGKGPIGQPFQSKEGRPFLHGVQVSQRDVTNKAGKTKTVKSITTFRTVSSKQNGTGAWEHPGIAPRNFFENTHSWAEALWRDKILPRLIDSIK